MLSKKLVLSIVEGQANAEDIPENIAILLKQAKDDTNFDICEDANSISPLAAAAHKGNFPVLKELLHMASTIITSEKSWYYFLNARTSKGLTSLGLAMKSQNNECIAMLVRTAEKNLNPQLFSQFTTKVKGISNPEKAIEIANSLPQIVGISSNLINNDSSSEESTQYGEFSEFDEISNSSDNENVENDQSAEKPSFFKRLSKRLSRRKSSSHRK